MLTRVGVSMRVDDGRERRDCVDQAWYPLLERAGLFPILLPNHPTSALDVASWVTDLGLTGVLLTGGNDLLEVPEPEQPAPERDELERVLLASCADARLPVLGVCRGMQKLVTHYGGRLQAVEGHVATRHALVASASIRPPLTARDEINSYHGYGVAAAGLGPHLDALAMSPDGHIEAVIHRELPHWGIMWHPERAPANDADVDLLRRVFGPPGRGAWS